MSQLATLPADPRPAFVQRQRACQRRYRTEPEAAWVVDTAHTHHGGRPLSDAMHTDLVVSSHDPHPVEVGVHRAVGGLHDGPTPGDLLAGALAACIDSTTRLVAARMDLELTHLAVEVQAHVDVRGTLLVDPAVPVPFQRIVARIDVRSAEGTDPSRVQALLQMVEHCCIVMQTLRHGVAVSLDAA